MYSHIPVCNDFMDVYCITVDAYLGKVYNHVHIGCTCMYNIHQRSTTSFRNTPINVYDNTHNKMKAYTCINITC